MPKFEKGNKAAANKGPNKVTREVREAYKMFVENNIEHLELWMQAVAEKNPDKALDFMLKFSEYFIPKLARLEHTGEEGKEIKLSVDFRKPTDNK